MRLNIKAKQLTAKVTLTAVLISSVLGNHAWGGEISFDEDHDWAEVHGEYYHNCLKDGECLESLQDFFAEENNWDDDWDDEQAETELIKEMLRVYRLFGTEPEDGWDAVADIYDLATASNASPSNATSSNADSKLPDSLKGLYREVRGELPKYQNCCAQIMNDLVAPMMLEAEDGFEYDIESDTGIYRFPFSQSSLFVSAGQNQGNFNNVRAQFSITLYNQDGEVVATKDELHDLSQPMQMHGINNAAFAEVSVSGLASAFLQPTDSYEIQGENQFKFSVTGKEIKAGEDLTILSNGTEITLHGVGESNTFENSRYNRYEGVLGIAGNFGIVAFEELQGNVDIHGNVLTGYFTKAPDFGTREGFNYTDFSYIKELGPNINNLQNKKSGAAIAVGSSHLLTLGTNQSMAVYNGNNKVNLEKFSEIYQEVEGGEPFIDLDAVQYEMESLSGGLSEYEQANVTVDGNKIEVSESEDNFAVYQYKPGTSNRIRYDLPEGVTLLINVDAAGQGNIRIPAGELWINGARIENGEGNILNADKAGKVLWNIYDSEASDGIFKGTVTADAEIVGSILTPGARFETNSNVDGTIIARVAIIGGESHQVDFTGDIPSGDEDTSGSETSSEEDTSVTESTEENQSSTDTTVTEKNTEITSESTTASTAGTEESSSTDNSTTPTVSEEDKSTTESTAETQSSKDTTVTEKNTEATSESGTASTAGTEESSSTDSSSAPTVSEGDKSTTESTAETQSSTDTSVTEETTEATSESSTGSTAGTEESSSTSGSTATTTNGGGGKPSTEGTTESQSSTNTGVTENTTVTEKTTETTSESTTAATTVTEGTTETTSEATTGTTAGTEESDSTNTTRRHSGGGGGGNGSGGGSSSNRSAETTPTPTTVIVDEAVPLGSQPKDFSGVGDYVLIADEDVPLASLPKTGDSRTGRLSAIVFALSALMICLLKRKEDVDA